MEVKWDQTYAVNSRESRNIDEQRELRVKVNDSLKVVNGGTEKLHGMLAIIDQGKGYRMKI